MDSSSMPSGGQPATGNVPAWRGFVVLFSAAFGLVTGLGSILVLVATVSQAWEEHVWAQWPEVTAQIQSCDLRMYTYKARSYRIYCSVGYSAHGEEIVSHVYSRSVPDPSRVIWQHPPGQFDALQEWVNDHPRGTSIRVHYDPANPKNAVLVNTDMPQTGPRTPNNLKLLGFTVVGFALMLAIFRIAKPEATPMSGGVSRGRVTVKKTSW